MDLILKIAFGLRLDGNSLKSNREAVQAEVFQGLFYQTGITSCQVSQINLSLRPPLCLSTDPHVLFGWLLPYPVPSMPSQIPVNFKTSPPPSQCHLVISLKDKSDCALSPRSSSLPCLRSPLRHIFPKVHIPLSCAWNRTSQTANSHMSSETFYETITYPNLSHSNTPCSMICLVLLQSLHYPLILVHIWVSGQSGCLPFRLLSSEDPTTDY